MHFANIPNAKGLFRNAVLGLGVGLRLFPSQQEGSQQGLGAGSDVPLGRDQEDVIG